MGWVHAKQGAPTATGQRAIEDFMKRLDQLVSDLDWGRRKRQKRSTKRYSSPCCINGWYGNAWNRIELHDIVLYWWDTVVHITLYDIVLDNRSAPILLWADRMVCQGRDEGKDECSSLASFILLPNESSKKSKSTFSCWLKSERRDAQDEVRRISKLARPWWNDIVNIKIGFY